MTQKTYSLHIGVSQVDENHYKYQLKPLACCATDAKLMYQFGAYLGYDKQTILLNEAATTTKVKEHIEAYSQKLVAGDLLVLTYSGHGSLIPDLNGDNDGTDGTWCLYDRQLIDDELPHLWKLFKEGVNILVILDSCHSGSAIKDLTDEVPKYFKQGESVFLAHKEMYAKILLQENVDEADVKCSVLLLSACQHEEEALSGDPVSYFTRIMMETICEQSNQLFSYENLYNKVREISAQEKVIYPNYMSYGKPTSFFDEQPPFLKSNATYPSDIDTFYVKWYLDRLNFEPMKIYALLIGINDYPIQPLGGCVDDVKKMVDYLDLLESDTVEVEKLLLTDAEAKKEAIVESIESFLGQATDRDVALFYYSGHGAYESSNNRFPEQHNNYLECLVSHFGPDQKSGYLLADKEIRYLLGKLPHHPHLVTVFDCCHAGDAVRDSTEEGQLKRIAKPFPYRAYEEFIFHKVISEDDLDKKSTAKNFPFKNHVHIAACSSSQSSWEDAEGGVFTRYLLTLLKATNNKISYQDIAQWADISLKEMTDKTQSPVCTIQGIGDVKVTSPWLNLHSGLSLRKDKATIVYNEKNGWLLSRGQLMGIQSGTTIKIDSNGQEIETTVDVADLTTSTLVKGKELGLDKKEAIYPVEINTIYKELYIFVNNIDGLPDLTERIQKIITDSDYVKLAKEASGADFFVTIFNGMVYISRKMDNFRPLAEQIDLLNKGIDLKATLQKQLWRVVRWNHYDSLINPGQNFSKPPIKVEIQSENDIWKDVTDREHTLLPRKDRMVLKQNTLGNLLQLYKLKVTNVSGEKLFVGVLQLDSKFGITSSPWNEQVIELNPDESKYFYDDSGSDSARGYIALDHYQEIYNWNRESLRFKFIVNNFESFTNQIKNYLQPPLSTPLTLSMLRSGGSLKAIVLRNQVEKKWTTLKTTLHLSNSKFDKVSGVLEGKLEEYLENEKLAPFIRQLYFEQISNGLHPSSDLVTPPDGERGFVKGRLLNWANATDDYLRHRIFEVAKLTMPNKPIVLAEGDSWFLYPFFVKDIVDYVMEAYPVRSIAAAGDELENYKKDGQLLKEVSKHQPKYVLISGGGNDIIGEEIQHLLVDNPIPAQPPEAYINEKFQENLDNLEVLYQYFIHELKTNHDSVQQVFIHGYDYIRVDHSYDFVRKGWVNRYMNEKGIEQVDRKNLIAFLINTFNEKLQFLAKNDPFVTYLDLRGQVKKGQWVDEIHPNDEGFETLGRIFIEAIDRQENDSTS